MSRFRKISLTFIEMANTVYRSTFILLFIVAVVHGRNSSPHDQDRQEARFVEDKTQDGLRSNDDKDIVSIQNRYRRYLDDMRDQDNDRRDHYDNRRDHYDDRRDQDDDRRDQDDDRRDQNDNRRNRNTYRRDPNDDRRDNDNNRRDLVDDRRDRNDDRRDRNDDRRDRNDDRRDQDRDIRDHDDNKRDQDNRREDRQDDRRERQDYQRERYHEQNQVRKNKDDTALRHRLYLERRSRERKLGQINGQRDRQQRQQDEDRRQINQDRRLSPQKILLLGVRKPPSDTDLRREKNDVLEVKDQVIVYDDGKLQRRNTDNDRLEVVRKDQDKTNLKSEVIVVNGRRERRDIENEKKYPLQYRDQNQQNSQDISRDNDDRRQDRSKDYQRAKYINYASPYNHVSTIIKYSNPSSFNYKKKVSSYKKKMINNYHQLAYDTIVNNRDETRSLMPVKQSDANDGPYLYYKGNDQLVDYKRGKFNDYSQSSRNRKADPFSSYSSSIITQSFPLGSYAKITSINGESFFNKLKLPMANVIVNNRHNVQESDTSYRSHPYYRDDDANSNEQSFSNKNINIVHSNPLKSMYNKEINSNHDYIHNNYDQHTSQGIINNRQLPAFNYNPYSQYRDNANSNGQGFSNKDINIVDSNPITSVYNKEINSNHDYIHNNYHQDNSQGVINSRQLPAFNYNPYSQYRDNANSNGQSFSNKDINIVDSNPITSVYNKEINSNHDDIHNNYNQHNSNGVINNRQLPAVYYNPYSQYRDNDANRNKQSLSNKDINIVHSNPITSVYNKEINSNHDYIHNNYDQHNSKGIINNRQLPAFNYNPYSQYRDNANSNGQSFSNKDINIVDSNPITSVYNKEINSNHDYIHNNYNQHNSNGVINNRQLPAVYYNPYSQYRDNDANRNKQSYSNTDEKIVDSNPITSVYNKEINSNHDYIHNNYHQHNSQGVINSRQLPAVYYNPYSQYRDNDANRNKQSLSNKDINIVDSNPITSVSNKEINSNHNNIHNNYHQDNSNGVINNRQLPAFNYNPYSQYRDNANSNGQSFSNKDINIVDSNPITSVYNKEINSNHDDIHNNYNQHNSNGVINSRQLPAFNYNPYSQYRDNANSNGLSFSNKDINIVDSNPITSVYNKEINSNHDNIHNKYDQVNSQGVINNRQLPAFNYNPYSQYRDNANSNGQSFSNKDINIVDSNPITSVYNKEINSNHDYIHNNYHQDNSQGVINSRQLPAFNYNPYSQYRDNANSNGQSFSNKDINIVDSNPITSVYNKEINSNHDDIHNNYNQHNSNGVINNRQLPAVYYNPYSQYRDNDANRNKQSYSNTDEKIVDSNPITSVYNKEINSNHDYIHNNYHQHNSQGVINSRQLPAVYYNPYSQYRDNDANRNKQSLSNKDINIVDSNPITSVSNKEINSNHNNIHNNYHQDNSNGVINNRQLPAFNYNPYSQYRDNANSNGQSFSNKDINIVDSNPITSVYNKEINSNHDDIHNNYNQHNSNGVINNRQLPAVYYNPYSQYRDNDANRNKQSYSNTDEKIVDSNPITSVYNKEINSNHDYIHNNYHQDNSQGIINNRQLPAVNYNPYSQYRDNANSNGQSFSNKDINIVDSNPITSVYNKEINSNHDDIHNNYHQDNSNGVINNRQLPAFNYNPYSQYRDNANSNGQSFSNKDINIVDSNPITSVYNKEINSNHDNIHNNYHQDNSNGVINNRQLPAFNYNPYSQYRDNANSNGQSFSNKDINIVDSNPITSVYNKEINSNHDYIHNNYHQHNSQGVINSRQLPAVYYNPYSQYRDNDANRNKQSLSNKDINIVDSNPITSVYNKEINSNHDNIHNKYDQVNSQGVINNRQLPAFNYNPYSQYRDNANSNGLSFSNKDINIVDSNPITSVYNKEINSNHDNIHNKYDQVNSQGVINNRQLPAFNYNPYSQYRDNANRKKQSYSNTDVKIVHSNPLTSIYKKMVNSNNGDIENNHYQTALQGIINNRNNFRQVRAINSQSYYRDDDAAALKGNHFVENLQLNDFAVEKLSNVVQNVKPKYSETYHELEILNVLDALTAEELCNKKNNTRSTYDERYNTVVSLAISEIWYQALKIVQKIKTRIQDIQAAIRDLRGVIEDVKKECDLKAVGDGIATRCNVMIIERIHRSSDRELLLYEADNLKLQADVAHSFVVDYVPEFEKAVASKNVFAYFLKSKDKIKPLVDKLVEARHHASIAKLDC